MNERQDGGGETDLVYQRITSRSDEAIKVPEDITKDTELSPDEKRQALNTWEQDARQMMTASNEGMEGDEEGLDQRDTHRLGEVVRAKEKVGAKPKHKPSQ